MWQRFKNFLPTAYFFQLAAVGIEWPKKDTTTGIVSPFIPSDEEIVNGKSSNGKWFDLQGCRLAGKPARGIYIEDGKKKVK